MFGNFLINLILLLHVHANVVYKAHNNDIDRDVAQCVSEVVVRYYWNWTDLLIIDASVSSFENNYEITELKKIQNITSFVYRHSGIEMQFQPVQSRIRQVVIYIDDFYLLDEVYQQMTPTSFYFGGIFTVVYTNKSIDNHHEIAYKTSLLSWSYFIKNMVIIMSNKSEVIVYNYFPMDSANCTYPKMQLADIWNTEKGFYNNNNLFPPKLLTFNGCHLRIATFELHPFIKMSPSSFPYKNYHLTGIEGSIINLLGKILNFSYIVTIPSDGVRWGTLSENGSWSGVAGLLQSNKVDLMVGAMFPLPERSEMFDCTKSYYTSNIVWAVSQGPPTQAWLKIFYPLGRNIWLSVTVLFLVAAFIIFCFRHIKVWSELVMGFQNHNPYLNLFGTFLGLSLTYVPKGIFARYLLIIWILYSLILRTSYQSCLVYFLTDNKNSPHVDTLDEMIEQDYTLCSAESGNQFFKGNEKALERFQITNKTFMETMLATLSSTYAKYALLNIKEVLDEYNKKVILKNKFVYTASEAILTSEISIYTRKSHPILKPLSVAIQRVIDVGLKGRIVDKYYTPSSRLIKYPIRSVEPMKLQMGHLIACFKILTFGLLLSSIAFIAEIVYFNVTIGNIVYN